MLSEAALTGLPMTAPLGGIGFTLPLPQEAALVFDHVVINWQPAGHPPPGIYDLPHFDVHFYLISLEQRNAMVPCDPEFDTKASRPPSPEAVPMNYVSDGIGVPRMGVHWNDAAAPEHHGGGFTRTFIYGFFDGTMVFIEPMVTKAFLESRHSRR